MIDRHEKAICPRLFLILPTFPHMVQVSIFPYFNPAHLAYKAQQWQYD